MVDPLGSAVRFTYDSKGELTTLVTGTGSWEQLELFADHLEPAKVTNPTPSASS